MKKKILLGLLVIVGLFTITGCVKDEKNKESTKDDSTSTIVIKSEDGKHKATLSDDNKDFQFNDEFANISSATIVDNEGLGISFNMYIEENTKEENDTYKATKKYSWNKYKGYTYGDNSNAVNFRIVLEKNDDYLVILNGKVQTIDVYDSSINVNDVFENKDVQDFLNTIKLVK